MKITISLDLPDPQWWALATVADRREVHIDDMVQAALMSIVRSASTPRDWVEGYVRAGLPDGEISKRTGMTVLSIASHRRALGLPPNRRAVWERQQREAAAAAEGQVA